MISAGAMNRRVRIEGATVTRDPESNEEIADWGLVAEVWAHRRDTSAKETMLAGSVAAQQVAVFTIWWREGLDATMQLVSQGQTFNINGIAEIGQRYQLQITGTATGSAAPQ